MILDEGAGQDLSGLVVPRIGRLTETTGAGVLSSSGHVMGGITPCRRFRCINRVVEQVADRTRSHTGNWL